MNTPIRDLLDGKGHAVETIDSDATVMDAVRRMAELEIGSLPVLEEGHELVGIVTERDCRGLILSERSAREVKVKEIMTRDLVTVSSDRSVEDCMQLMTERRVRHLPVIDCHKIVGLISIGDVVKFLSSERERMIENLEKYITGSI